MENILSKKTKEAFKGRVRISTLHNETEKN